MYSQNVAAAGAGAPGPEVSASTGQAGFDSARLHALRDRLAQGHAQQVPVEEMATAAFEFLLTGGGAGFEEAARHAVARGSGPSMLFDDQSRAIPELVAGMVDRGMPVRYVLGMPPERVYVFANCWTRGWSDLPPSRRGLCPPKMSSERSAGEHRLREAVKLLRPGEAAVVFPASGDVLMAARDRDGLLLMARDERGAQGLRPTLYQGRDADKRLEQALLLPGRGTWGMVQAAVSP